MTTRINLLQQIQTILSDPLGPVFALGVFLREQVVARALAVAIEPIRIDPLPKSASEKPNYGGAVAG